MGYVDSVVVKPISPGPKMNHAGAAAFRAVEVGSKSAPESSGLNHDEIPFMPERK